MYLKKQTRFSFDRSSDNDTDRLILGRRTKQQREDLPPRESIEVKIESIEETKSSQKVIKGIPLDRDFRLINPISEIINELNTDLRHSSILVEADDALIDGRALTYSADYEAYLSSYE